MNITNGSKICKDKTDEALINRLLAITFLLQVIKEVIYHMNTYKQDMIAVGNETKAIKNRDIWNY